MSSVVGPMVAGAVVGAVATDIVEDVKERTTQVTTGSHSIEHGPIELHMLVDMLANIERAIAEAANRYHPRLERIRQWSTNVSEPLNRQGYKHLYVLSTTPFTIQATTKIGLITLNIVTGLTSLDILPDHCEILLTSGGPTNVVYIYSDERYI